MRSVKHSASRFTIGSLIVSLVYGPLLSSVASAQTPPTTPTTPPSQTTTTQFEYDAKGNITKRTDARGKVTTQTYDTLNRPVVQVQPSSSTGGASPTIQLTYDGLDQLQTVTDPRSLVTSYTTTGLGDQTGLVSPDTGPAAMTFDAAGNLKTRKDARNKTVTYSYDALNRLTLIDYPTGVDTAMVYDGGTTGAANTKGRLTKVTDESGTTAYTYDGFGRVLSKNQTVGTVTSTGTAAKVQTIAYTWGTVGTATGKIASITYPSGNRINVSYNANGQVSALSLNPTNTNGTGTNTAAASTVNLLTAIAYTPFNTVQAWQWGNHTSAIPSTVTRTYDLDGRLTSYPLGHRAQSGLVRTVQWDEANRITGYTHTSYTAAVGTTPASTPNQPSFAHSFGYDDLNRVTSWTQNTATQSFGYDVTGNRTQLGVGASTFAYATSATSNRLTSTAGPLPAKTNAFDAAGNLTSNGTATFTYSDRGRMASSKVGANTVTYLYNAMEQRTKKTGPAAVVPTGTNYYAYDEQGMLIGEYDANNKVISETVYLGSTPVALLKQTTTGSGTTTAVATTVHYIYADQIDTPRVITRASDNKMVWRWDQADPFGMAAANENPQALGVFNSNQRFPGQLYDKETNLHYNWHRDYDPQVGRYVQSDLIGLQGGINTFAYVGGDPLVKFDINGLLIMTTINGVRTGGTLAEAVNDGIPGTVAAGIAVAVIVVPVASYSLKFCPAPARQELTEFIFAVILASGAGNGGSPDIDKGNGGKPSRNSPRDGFDRNGGGKPSSSLSPTRRRTFPIP